MSKRTASFLIVILLISSMGPYILPNAGIRIEHVVLYGLTFFFIFNNGVEFLAGKKPRHIYVFLIIFFFLISIYLFRTVFSEFKPKIFKVLADLDNYLQPVLLILVTSYTLRRLSIEETYEVLTSIFKTAIILLSFNALLAITSIFYGTWFMAYFNTSGAVEEGALTVYNLAAGGGRFTGIFNQPVESGIAYGQVLLLSVLMFTLKTKAKVLFFSNKFIVFGLSLVLVGGILSVSKAFFPLAAVIALIILVIYFRNRLRTIFKILFLIGIVLIVAISFFLSQWAGADYFLRLIFIAEDIDLISLYTADRFGGAGTTNSLLQGKFSNPELIFGYGLGSIQTPDNAYLEVLYFGGYLGILVYASIFISFFFFAIKYYRVNKVLCTYLIAFTFFILMAAMGIPIFGVNRSNFYLLIPFITIYQIVWLQRKQKIQSKTTQITEYIF